MTVPILFPICVQFFAGLTKASGHLGVSQKKETGSNLLSQSCNVSVGFGRVFRKGKENAENEQCFLY